MSTANSVLSPEAFARTYSPQGYADGWEQIDQYLLVTEWSELNPEASWQMAAKTLDLPKSRVQSWYAGKKPYALKQLEIVDTRGWIDATWETALGRAFNHLAAAILSGGSLSKDYNPRITLDDDLDAPTEKSLHTALEKLVGSSRITHADDPQRATVLEPGADQALLGRSLHAIGVPRGRKTEGDLTLPSYLATAPDPIRTDFVEIYVIFRGSRRERGTVDIREERSDTYLESLAELIEGVTGGKTTVRQNGIFLRKSVVDALTGTVSWETEP
jgi:hypothetical protein